jgi:hypothetical protein
VKTLVQRAVNGYKTMCVNHLSIEQYSESLMMADISMDDGGVFILAAK